jgi:hypothetical protein
MSKPNREEKKVEVRVKVGSCMQKLQLLPGTETHKVPANVKDKNLKAFIVSQIQRTRYHNMAVEVELV